MFGVWDRICSQPVIVDLQLFMEGEEEYGVLALVLGDFHVPHRTGEVPAKYKEILTPNQFAYVLCTGNPISHVGNLGSREIQDWIKTLAPQVHIVRGDF